MTRSRSTYFSSNSEHASDLLDQASTGECLTILGAEHGYAYKDTKTSTMAAPYLVDDVLVWTFLEAGIFVITGETLGHQIIGEVT